MVGVGDAYKIAKSAVDGNKKIKESLEEMKKVSVAGTNASFATKSQPVKSGKSLVDLLIYSAIFFIYGAVIFLI